MKLTTRNATLGDLAALLQDQQARKVDVVAPAAAITAERGLLRVENTEAQLDVDGVTPTAGLYRPTTVCDEGIASKLGIPVGYLKTLREQRVDLYDANVNGWLHGFVPGQVVGDNQSYPSSEPDSRSFLVRAFRGDDGTGVARALLSDSYKRIDNLDVVTAALDGVRAAGVPVEIDGCDLTERRMYVRVVCPEIAVHAPALLEGYRSPFWSADVRRAGEEDRYGSGPNGEPIVFAGFVIANSETGCGAFTLTPRLVIQVCRNGLTYTSDALRSVHLGGRLEEGIVRWSEETLQHSLTLVTSQARDAVSTFLDRDYVAHKLEELSGKATKPLANPAEAVKVVGQRLRFTQERIDAVFDHFLRGGQVTAGGVMQAVTSVAQTIPDADEAYEMEAQALAALDVAAAL